MGISRSTYYETPTPMSDDTAIVEAMAAICDEFENYGWRRVRAALRQQGMVVNHKKIKRLMREHDLQPRLRRRFVATTDSDHDDPIFPNLARDLVVDGPNQLWVADITYVTILAGFVYVAVILDAWSRRVVGYAISRSIDARLTLAALAAARRRWAPEKTLEEFLAPRAKNIPLRRLGTQEGVAEAILFFAMPSSAYVTGQCLAVDGGGLRCL